MGSEMCIRDRSTELADSDLLTQAMAELTQSFGSEFRLLTANVSSGSEYQTVVPCIVSISSTTTEVDQGLQTSGPTLDAGSSLVFSQPVAQVVQKVTPQILQTVPRTVSSSALYTLPCIGANAVTKNILQ